MTSQEQTFPQKLEALVKAFVVAERPGETDAEVAVAVLDFVFSYERLRKFSVALPREGARTA